MKKTLSLSEKIASKIQPKPWYIQLGRIAIIWTINVVAIWIAIAIMPGVQSNTFVGGIFIFAGVVALLNAFIRPILVHYTLPITMMTLGLITFVINGLIFSLAGRLLPVIQFDTFWQAIWMSVLVALITWVAQILLSIDDSDSYYYSVVKRMGQKRAPEGKVSKKPGFVYLEIDGLANPVLQQALANGVMPTLKQLLDESHQITEWETDLPAQTCASQIGILHGNNWNAIGFRWYDRKKKLMFTASNPKFVAALESQVTNGKGLLAGNGASIGNMFTGDAAITAFSTSASGQKDKKNPYDLLSYYFVNPYNYVHTLALVFWEVIHEYRDIRKQEKEQRSPRIHRGWESALQRAIMCIVVPDMAVQSTIGEMYAGRDAIYMTYAGYDELSHLSGLNRPEAMRGLSRVDRALYYLLLSMQACPREYKLVILSDHGQSMGWTFNHTYKQALGDVVKAGCKPGTDVREVAGVDEIGIVVGDIMTDIRRSLRSKFSLGIFRSVARRLSPGAKDDDVLVIDKNAQAEANVSGFAILPEVLVQVGGNLAMIYFTKEDRQLELREITKRQPKLIPTLVTHPGIGIAMVKTEHGPLVFGKAGKHYLNWNNSGKDRVDGVDPLAPFGPNAVRHLLRVAAFDTCPDILAISTYNAATEEIIGFEPQCGAHGALGGPQNRPFMVYPRELKLTDAKIIGAENIYKQLKTWQKPAKSR